MVFLVNGENHLFVEGGFFFWRMVGLSDCRAPTTHSHSHSHAVSHSEVFSDEPIKTYHRVLRDGCVKSVSLAEPAEEIPAESIRIRQDFFAASA